MTNANAAFMDTIYKKIKAERNIDFSMYRNKLLERRVMVRVRATRCVGPREYIRYLDAHPAEMDYLVDTMTINVTEFFRDSKVFDVIEKKIIPEMLLRKRGSGSTSIRVWSCGSSSGEEAYSVLMLLAEALGPALARYKLTIFGTDIDGQALAKAREGVYEASQFARLSDERKTLINRYFYDLSNERYWVREEWPGYMDFRYHDVIADVPLNSMDMILCRNLFIYFGHDLQVRITGRFYDSLDRGGFLVLGNVESLWGEVRDMFVEYDRGARIYLKT
ncbi:MAG: protein-glutamate O-methyltransferase CheR [Candidatus Omnitrophota bacterium]